MLKNIARAIYKDMSLAHDSTPCQGFSAMNTAGSEASEEKNNQLCLVWPVTRMTSASLKNVTGMLYPKRVGCIQ